MHSPLGDRYLSARIAQRLALASNAEGPGFESHCRQEFFIL